ncbi:MAG TPA: tetratricopeptide repeat protein [Azospirillaceae bacterium]|nr:tetratricopeptide repeat protein [Azospirillaceae bacterium]
MAGRKLLGMGVAQVALAVALALPAMAAEKETARSPVAAYLSGRLAQGAGDWSLAARHLAEALKADPDNVQLLRRTFLLQLGAGQYPEAVASARRLDKADAESFLAASLLIADDLAAKRLAEAGERVRKLPPDGLGQYVTPLLDAWLKVSAGDDKAAVEALAPLDKAPGFAALRALQSALIADLAGDVAGARDWYARAAEGGAPLRLTSLAANFHERNGDPEAARALWQAYLKDNPANAAAETALAAVGRGKVARLVTSPRDGLAEALFDVAGALHQENAGEMALLYGRVSLYLRAEQPMARLMVADVLAGRGRHEEALAEYRAIGQTAGLDWSVRLRQVEVLRKLQRETEAAKLLEAMAAERPERTDALIRLGDMRRAAEKNEQALAAYDKALLRVKSPGPKDWPLFYARAMALDGLGRWPQAEADLLKALELSPDQPQLLNYLGYSWVDRNLNLEKGTELIRRAAELRPDDGYIVDSLGWALFRAGDIDGAIATLERAVQLKPMDPAINDHLGDAYWAAGRHKEARFQWSRAFQNDPKGELRTALEEKLRREPPARKTAANGRDAE